MAHAMKPTCSRALRLALSFALLASSQAEISLADNPGDLSEDDAENPSRWWKADGTLANALKPAEDSTASQRILIVDGESRRVDKVACNLVYYENATSGGGQMTTQCFAKPVDGEAFGRRVKLASKRELPRNYQWGQYVDVEFIYPRSGKVALRSVPQEEPRLPEARVVTLSDADASPSQTSADAHPDHAAAVWPKKMRVLAMIPQLSDGSGTGGRSLGLTAQRRVAALTEELLGKGTTSVNSTFGAGSFNQLQLSKAHSQVLHLPLLDHSYTELLNTCHGSGHIGGEHCCEKNGDTLKAAMLAKLPEGVRTQDFDILVYYLRGDLLGCPSGRDGYSYFGTTPPNRAAPGFKVRRDMTAWKAGVTMYEGGINNAHTLAHAIGHSLGLHHAGGEGPKQPPKAAEGAFTEFAMAGDGLVQKKSITYGEEDAFMGSVRTDPTGESTPQAETFTAPVSSYLGFLPDEQVIQAISVGDEVHSLAELRAYELGPMGHQGDGLAMRIACPDGCKPKVRTPEPMPNAQCPMPNAQCPRPPPSPAPTLTHSLALAPQPMAQCPNAPPMPQPMPQCPQCPNAHLTTY